MTAGTFPPFLPADPLPAAAARHPGHPHHHTTCIPNLPSTSEIPSAPRTSPSSPRDRTGTRRTTTTTTTTTTSIAPSPPPPEMNGVTNAVRPVHDPQEHGYGYGDCVQGRAGYRPGPYYPQEVSNTEFGHNGVPAQPASRPPSPAPQPKQQPGPSDYPYKNQQPKPSSSQSSAIAPSFQIPKTVNDSGGSLSELAAQITCLFWFESSDILHQVEDSKFQIHSPRQLVSDAKPTTGFRKWVTTILSTTLVAQNVVLLALLFVYRLKKLNPTVRGKPGSEYRLLTVALMLGNKFLDDNTYTNKTWAEVSGINVTEVHIMEVEFLSNMKYCLFTSAEDWSEWQSLLGKFAEFFERASKPQPRNPPAPVLPPASTLHLPMALPSPPPSNQASPPYASDPAQSGSAYATTTQPGPTPAPSPLTVVRNSSSTYVNSRKRSRENNAEEPAAKRVASEYQNHQSPGHHAATPAHNGQTQPIPRLTLPSLTNPPSHSSSNGYNNSAMHKQQLPPLQMPGRGMAMVYPPISGTEPLPPNAINRTAPAVWPGQTHTHSHYSSRQQSPLYPSSGANSPANSMPPQMAQISPKSFLRQRNSPYRPIHNVSTLLYPPPSAALQHRPQSVEYNQMHYQPLGKPIDQRQTGHLPYVSQNVWLDESHQKTMTPVHQWPSFLHQPRPEPGPQH